MALTADQRAAWSVRFGTIAGAVIGIQLAFVAAWLAERAGKDPEWILRAGSAAGMLLFGWLGRKVGAIRGGALYAPLGMLTGLLVAVTSVYLLMRLFTEAGT